MYRGKLVILFIFGLSTVMGGFACWHHYQQGRRCLELWGAETATLIRYAPRVHAMVLASDGTETEESLTIGDQEVAVIASGRITGTPGLVHARQALIEDASYLWDDAPPSKAPAWKFALRFVDEEGAATIVLDVVGNRVRLVETGREGVLTRHLMEVYQDRVPRWLGQAN